MANYMKQTNNSSMHRFGQRSNRLRHLTRELEVMQSRIAGRLSEYQRERVEAENLVTRAAALTVRLRDVREKLQSACELRRRLFALSLAVEESSMDITDALPGLGIDDDVQPQRPVAKLPEFADQWDLYSDEAPQEYLCPITCGIMRVPVQTSDGHFYEKRAIEEWFHSFESCPTSPLTNLPLKSLELIPAVELSKQIREWVKTREPRTPPPPSSPPAKANTLSHQMSWQGRSPSSPPITPIWSSSVVPVEEMDSSALNAIRDMFEFQPPHPHPHSHPRSSPPAVPLTATSAPRGGAKQRAKARHSSISSTSQPLAGMAVSALRSSRNRSLNHRCIKRR
eukprot:TRINITY_DN6779_c0_g1_i1.p1 TRINITY_DN6779_c0_g1~~TRINITY_DN6779_c0_g1_i1.p1  ORF type:complete len:354 (+),score=53.27 TRINITY_DN6779_c0_g1_i1:48-1064(+)